MSNLKTKKEIFFIQGFFNCGGGVTLGCTESSLHVKTFSDLDLCSEGRLQVLVPPTLPSTTGRLPRVSKRSLQRQEAERAAYSLLQINLLHFAASQFHHGHHYCQHFPHQRIRKQSCSLVYLEIVFHKIIFFYNKLC